MIYIISDLNNMASETLKVPTSTRPALIGLKGEKIQDIRNTSGATIWFDRQTGPITNAHIQGSREQIELAIAILKLSVLHARAKDYRPLVPHSVPPGHHKPTTTCICLPWRPTWQQPALG